MPRKPILNVCAALAIVGGLTFACFRASDASATQQGQAQAEQQGGPPAGQDPFPGLLEALKEIEGCLGIEPAQTQSGKQVLFVWFEDKAAAMRWYESEYHQTVMYRFFPDEEFGDAMAEIADDSGPIMAIASVTPATDQKIGQLPISQIAIELYGPLKGGLAFGGTFAPEAVQELMKKREEEAAAVGGR